MSVGTARDHLLRMVADAQAVGATSLDLFGASPEVLGIVAEMTGAVRTGGVSHCPARGGDMFFESAHAHPDDNDFSIGAYHSRPATADEIAALVEREGRAA